MRLSNIALAQATPPVQSTSSIRMRFGVDGAPPRFGAAAFPIDAGNPVDAHPAWGCAGLDRRHRESGGPSRAPAARPPPRAVGESAGRTASRFVSGTEELPMDEVLNHTGAPGSRRLRAAGTDGEGHQYPRRAGRRHVGIRTTRSAGNSCRWSTLVQRSSRSCRRSADCLYTTRRRPILRIVEDTSPGVHDTLMAACDSHRYGLLGCTEYHDNCTDNLWAAMHGSGSDSTGDAEPAESVHEHPVAEHRGAFVRPSRHAARRRHHVRGPARRGRGFLRLSTGYPCPSTGPRGSRPKPTFRSSSGIHGKEGTRNERIHHRRGRGHRPRHVRGGIESWSHRRSKPSEGATWREGVRSEAWEGDWQAKRMVIIEFDDMERAKSVARLRALCAGEGDCAKHPPTPG